MTYSAPRVTDLGSVRDLTLAAPNFNKVGNESDIYSNLVPLVGSLVPPPGA